MNRILSLIAVVIILALLSSASGVIAQELGQQSVSGDAARYAHLSIGADGLSMISYYDVTNGDQKVLHCSNPFCVPYFRRR